MQTLNLNYTHPPLDAVMPATPQLVTTVIFGVGALAFVLYALYLSYRHKSALPVLFILGSLLTIYLEAFVDIVGNALHPPVGQFNLLTVKGHPIPWAMVGYVWYYAGAPLVCYKQLRERTITPSFLWKTFAAVAIGAVLVEQIPLSYGVWLYYGYAPHKIGMMPAWFVFANTSSVLVSFIIIYKLLPLLAGWRQFLVVWLMPSGAFMGHTAAGWPMYMALGTDTATFPHLIIQLASLCSIALSFLTVWAMIKVAGLDVAHGRTI